jgi:hypothetical protein
MEMVRRTVRDFPSGTAARRCLVYVLVRTVMSYGELAENAALAMVLKEATAIATFVNTKLSPADLFSLFRELVPELESKLYENHVCGLLGVALDGRQLGIPADYRKSLHDVVMGLAAVHW